MMQKDASSILQMPDMESLEIINGVKFTHRELDIIACLLSGKTIKTIAAFLSISPKTADAHIRNVMLKAGCNSRESIINFTEKSDTASLFRKRYQNLSLQAKFEEQLQKVSALARKKDITCHIADKRQDKGKEELLKRLTRDLEHAGIHVTDGQGLQKLDYTIVICDIVQAGFRGKPFIIFNALENYYFSVFEVLRVLLPAADAEKLVAVFKGHDDEASSCDHVNVWSRIEEKLQRRTVSPYSWTRKFVLVVIPCLLFLGILIFSMTSHKGISVSLNTQLSEVPVRSDLLVPTDAAFLNRPELMKQLEEKLKGEGEVQRVALIGIVGIGGAGKTTLARQFGRLHTSLVWELNAETKKSLMNSFKGLAYALAKTKDQKNELDFIDKIQSLEEKEKQLLAFVKDHLRGHKNWLLIYDNVESLPEIKNYFPQDFKVWGQGKVIITTCNGNIMNSGYIKQDNVIQIEELTEEEALKLFVKIIYDSKSKTISQDDRGKILAFLKNIPPFPLDVSIAAYYIKSARITYDQYLGRIGEYSKTFENAQENLLKEVSNYTKTRYGIITSSLEGLIDKNPANKELLFFTCLLDPQNIPRGLLDLYMKDSNVDDFIRDLRETGLITSESSSEKNEKIPVFSMHRSIQKLSFAFLRNLLSEREKTNSLHQIITAIMNYYESYARSLPETYATPKSLLEPISQHVGNVNTTLPAVSYKNLILLIPHLEALLANMETIEIPESFKEKYKKYLFVTMGYIYYKCLRNIILTIKYFSRALEDKLNHQYFSKHTTAVLLRTLGIAYAYLEDLDNAFLYANESLKLCKEIPNSEFLVANNLKTLAFVSCQKNYFNEAKNYFEMALNKISAINGESKQYLASELYGQMAMLYSGIYLNREEAHQAEIYAYKALEILKPPPFHDSLKIRKGKISWFYVARYKWMLGQIYSRLGKYDDAMKYGYSELESIIKQDGFNYNPYFLKARLCEGMGEVMLRKGDLNAAENKLSEGINFGPEIYEYEDTRARMRTRVFRAEARIRLGKLEAAYDDCNVVFNLKQRHLNNYQNLIHSTAFYHAATIKYKQADFKKSFEHFSNFFKSMNKFCKSFLDEKKYMELKEIFTEITSNDKAISSDFKKYFQNSVRIFSKIYGPSHPFVRDYVLINYHYAERRHPPIFNEILSS